MRNPMIIGFIGLSLAACGSRLDSARYENQRVATSGHETSQHGMRAGREIGTVASQSGQGIGRGVQGAADATAFGAVDLVQRIDGTHDQAAAERDRDHLRDMSRENFDRSGNHWNEAGRATPPAARETGRTAGAAAATVGHATQRAGGAVRRSTGEQPNHVDANVNTTVRGGGPRARIDSNW